MGEITYKIWPHGWLRGGTFLIATKQTTTTSYGKTFIRYTITRKCQNYFPIDNSGLVGVEYNPNELRKIEQNSLVKTCESQNFGAPLHHSNEQNNTMTTKDIYQLASELTEKQINNVLGAWNKDGDTEELRSFNSLVSLGDSKPLALATTIAKKYNSKDNYNTYYNAYCI